ncbi:unnamed protein product [Clavelina lepadiformis]|uniref:Uncharacterized protein n=1 Tax=Clavelina lepadiformis TaxID=159417 RepID=A0ABP0FI87_CLALP
MNNQVAIPLFDGSETNRERGKTPSMDSHDERSHKTLIAYQPIAARRFMASLPAAAVDIHEEMPHLIGGTLQGIQRHKFESRPQMASHRGTNSSSLIVKVNSTIRDYSPSHGKRIRK